MNFNLLDEGFIPVLWSDGKVGRVGIRRALAKAGRIRQIAASNPMDNVALLRFLLAVLQWCRPNPTPAEIVKDCAEGIPGRWLEGKLGSAREPNPAFDLLGDNCGFYQDGEQCDKVASWSAYLLHELPAGTNVAHFRHLNESWTRLCRACAAVGLARLPLFTTQGGKGKPPGINDKPPVYFVPVGRTLLETLIRNWPFKCLDYDHPVWDRDASVPRNQQPVGVLEGFTWLPRGVWIDRGNLGPGLCAACGAADEQAVGKIAFEGDPRSLQRNKGSLPWRDRHVARPRAPKSKDDGHSRAANSLDYLAGASAQWRAIWQGVLTKDERPMEPPDAVVSAAARLDAGEVLTVEAVGFASDQNKYVECWARRLQVPSTWITQPAERDRVAARVALLGAAIGYLPGTLTPPQSRRRNVEIDSAIAVEQARLETVIDGQFVGIADISTEEFPARLTDLCCETVERVVAVTTPGSPLRRREAQNRAGGAISGALRSAQDWQAKEASKAAKALSKNVGGSAPGAQGKAKPRRAKRKGGAE